MISNYKYVMFDIDGVVLSSINYYATLFREIAENLGAPRDISDDFYRKNIGIKLTHWMIKVIPEENHHKIRGLFFEKNMDRTELHRFPLIEGTKDTLLKIKEKNYKTCFISTKSRDSIDVLLKYYKLETLIDFSVSGDEVEKFKPDPEGIVKALQYFNAHPGEAVFVGDSIHDLGAARNANVTFIGVLSGICTKTDWQSEKVLYVPSIKEVYL